MHDLRTELGPVWRAATRLGATSTSARVLMFTSARSGEGVSSMAASFACVAAQRSDKPVWLVDLDFRSNTIFNGFKNGFAPDIGRPGRAYDASLKQPQIYTITPRIAEAKQEKLLIAHDIDKLNLLVTRFRGERVKGGQRVVLQESPNWWRALRQMAGWVIIDAPALEHSSAAVTMAGVADGTILVVRSDSTTPAEIDGARREIEAKTGRILGAVMNRVKADARLANRFSA